MNSTTPYPSRRQLNGTIDTLASNLLSVSMVSLYRSGRISISAAAKACKVDIKGFQKLIETCDREALGYLASVNGKQLPAPNAPRRSVWRVLRLFRR